MLHSKPTLRSIFAMNSSIISTIMITFKSLLVAHQNYPFRASLGMMLLSLTLLMSIIFWMLVTFTLSLLFLIETMLMKLLGLFSNTGMPGWNAQYILCRWGDAVKNIPLTYRKWRNSAWRKDGDLHQDSTYLYSEMPGGLEEVAKYNSGIVSEEQLENIRKKL